MDHQQQMDNRHRYTCNISSSDFSIPKNSGDDGFILEIIVTTRFGNFYYHSEGKCWILNSISEALNLRTATFLVKRAPIMLGSIEQTLEEGNLSIVLDVLEIPEVEHREIAAQIKQYAKEEAYNNNPPELLPILVEIGKWIPVNITNQMLFGDYHTPTNFEEEGGDLDFRVIFEQIAGIRPKYLPANITAMNKLVESSENEELNCIICLDQMQVVGTNVIRLHCLHVFHSTCILQWLSKKNKCPVCRDRIPVEFEAGKLF